jgi:hypothetical protein
MSWLWPNIPAGVLVVLAMVLVTAAVWLLSRPSGPPGPGPGRRPGGRGPGRPIPIPVEAHYHDR